MSERRQYYVYIVANRTGGTLYTGVTNDLIRRVGEHRQGEAEGFTRRYGIKMLVYFEVHESIEAAITREKRIKNWNRGWRIRLIEEQNPDWHDLYPELIP